MAILPESEVAKSAKGYRGDPRFMQYCRQYMASKLLEGTEQPGRQSESQAKLSRIVEWVAKERPPMFTRIQLMCTRLDFW